MLEVKSLAGSGYNKIFQSDSWLVAHLSHNEDTNLQCISYLQKHEKSDEVFVLLKGKMSLLIVGDEKNIIDSLEVVNLEFNRAYLVKAGVYHQHILSEDANVLIMENASTSDDNSPLFYLDEIIRKQFYLKVKGASNV